MEELRIALDLRHQSRADKHTVLNNDSLFDVLHERNQARIKMITQIKYFDAHVASGQGGCLL